MKKSSVLILLLFITVLPLLSEGNPVKASPEGRTAGEIIALIIKKTGSKIIPNTVDVIKEGSPDTQVTGIVSCMFATMDVLQQAVEKKCNMIVVHEPLYYNHLDNTTQLQNDPVFQEKQKYIRDHKLVIWRFHDYIHSMKPDGIMTGMAEKLKWNKYMVNSDLSRYAIPETTLHDLLKYLKAIFPENAFYVVGKPDMKVRNVRFAPGAPGSQLHIKILEDTNTDVLLAGESPQWETYEYMRDAVDQGRNKAVVFLGHINSEQAGMEFCARWLKGFISDIPVYYVESGPSYWSY
ncbi:MAG TPA: Nif3-like dinuclear metal center hexameric protein [Bacteroidales bacterium]|nr:Nif3-like dinuclear metal center hexameric protein [Bacteroidales bacterium]